MIARLRLALPITLPLAACTLLAGCTGVGDTDPHARLPAVAGAGAQTSATAVSGVPAQAFTIGESTPRAWWKEFGCADLDKLVDEGLAGSNDIAAADAALRAARAQAAVAGAALAPGVDVSYSGQRTRSSASLQSPLADSSKLLYSLQTAQVTVNYPLDVFGGLRARRQSARAAASVAAAHLLAARQTLAANLVIAAVGRAALADQITATEISIRSARDMLEMTRKRRTLGDAGDADVAAQEAALATAEATLPALQRSEAHQRALIAALLGRAPDEALPPPPSSTCFVLPAHMPVALPASVVRGRPDVQAAAAAVEGSAADARAAIAARFPSFVLTASAGGAAQTFSNMFQDGNVFWSLLGGVTAPVFHAGALRRQQQAALAVLDQTKAQYRTVVLQAFVDVSDAINGLQADARAEDATARALSAAEQSYAFTRRQQELGEVGTFALLQSQATVQQARLQRSAAWAARLVDTVALYQANGQAEDGQGQ
ncbi:efflux transporter outer membrane subunit [Novosphingobium sp.]|uniref:efflux transporter outer membrane subunit n=1 Tax=Novosphingobium sp. TaxID=1874826 RepID=UPI003BAD8E0E